MSEYINLGWSSFTLFFFKETGIAWLLFLSRFGHWPKVHCTSHSSNLELLQLIPEALNSAEAASGRGEGGKV